MRVHVLLVWTLVAIGVLGGIGWVGNWWRNRDDVEHEPWAVALLALEDLWWTFDDTGDARCEGRG